MKIRFEMTAKEFTLVSNASSKVAKRFESVKKDLGVLFFGPKEEPKTNLVNKMCQEAVQLLSVAHSLCMKID